MAAPAEANSNLALVLGQAQTADQITVIINGGPISNGPGTSLTTEPTMFWVDNRQSTLANANGIRGDGRGLNGLGVWGHSDSGGIDVFEVSSSTTRTATSGSAPPAARPAGGDS